MSRPISDFVLPRLNIVRPLAPRSIPASQGRIPASAFLLLRCFAWPEKSPLPFGSDFASNPMGPISTLAETGSTNSPGTLPLNRLLHPLHGVSTNMLRTRVLLVKPVRKDRKGKRKAESTVSVRAKGFPCNQRGGRAFRERVFTILFLRWLNL